MLPKLYLDFQDMFSKESFNELPEQKQWDHAIDLKPESQPFSTKVYPVSPIKQKTAYEMILGDWSSDVCSSDLMYKSRREMSGKLPSEQIGASLNPWSC